jgi:hypothetical protein
MDDAPLAACQQCRQAVVVLERQQSSPLVTLALLPLGVLPAVVHEIWRRSTRRLACAACGSPSLVPAGSPAARELLGSDHDRLVHRVRMHAAVLLEGARAGAAAEARSVGRVALASVAGVILVFGSVAAWHAWTPSPAERRGADPRAGTPPIADPSAGRGRARAANRSAVDLLPERIAITIETLARAAPSADAEAVMRLDAGDEFVAGRRVDGWVALADAPVTAWVPEAATTPAAGRFEGDSSEAFPARAPGSPPPR